MSLHRFLNFMNLRFPNFETNSSQKKSAKINNVDKAS